MADAPKYTTGDTAPALSGAVNADLTGATATVHIKRPDGTVISAPVTVTDPATGAWSYAWQAGDLTVQGTWTAEVEVKFSGGGTQTFGAASFTVRDQIA